MKVDCQMDSYCEKNKFIEIKPIIFSIKARNMKKSLMRSQYSVIEYELQTFRIGSENPGFE